MMKRALALAAVVLIVVLAAACRPHETSKPAAAAAAKPDVILVTIDTVRADSVGYAGNTRVRTPFLDRMAREGIAFTNAHAHNVVTLPSHTNILTGLYPYQHGVRDNAGFRLDPKHETLGTMLRRAGYTTGAFVGAFPLDARFGLNQGFDVYDDNYGKGAASLDFVVQERPAPAVLDAAMRWWRANEGRKRFLWIHLYDPHAPYRPPEPFATEYAADPYLGEIAAVDDALGKALGPVVDGALLVITSDHGEGRGDHGEQTHGLFAYEATLHIPLIVRVPGGAQHRVESEYVRHVDIAPTILEYAGVAKPPALPGVSLLAPPRPSDSYFEALSTSLNRSWAPLTGVIHGREKYIDLPVAELYDLPRDPAEAHNLRPARRREVDDARRILASMHGQETPASRNISAEEAARLRSLGYLGGAAAAKATYGEADDPKNLVLDNQMHEVIDAYEAHDLPRALRLAKGVVAARPGMAAGRELLAFVQQQSERPADAIENLRVAITSGSATESMRVQLALLLTEGGKAAEALEVLSPVVNGGDPDALNAYGIALADEGKLDDAAQQFQHVLAADPNNAPALQNLGIVALRRDDVAGAQTYLGKALELNPRLPLALNTMGVVYARQGDFARAVDFWNRAVDVDPRQYDALYNAGLVEGRAGHLAQAKAALSRFVATAPRERYGADIAAARRALEGMP
jgi:arylsulfatase A-like enzyme/Flp pilus assembly protein TadD